MKYLIMRKDVDKSELEKMGFQYFYDYANKELGMSKLLDGDGEYIEFWFRDYVIEAWGAEATSIAIELLQKDMAYYGERNYEQCIDKLKIM